MALTRRKMHELLAWNGHPKAHGGSRVYWLTSLRILSLIWFADYFLNWWFITNLPARPWRVPIMIGSASLAVLATLLLIRHRARLRRSLDEADYRLCVNCGYRIIAESNDQTCSECGARLDMREVRRIWMRLYNRTRYRTEFGKT
jgi:hypothetical protein